jgi:hypothetical protein
MNIFLFKYCLFVQLFLGGLVTFSCSAAYAPKIIGMMTSNSSKIDDTKNNLKYYVTLAISSRPDLQEIKKQLNKHGYDALNSSSKSKLDNAVSEIKSKFDDLNLAIRYRNKAADNILKLYQDEEIINAKLKGNEKNRALLRNKIERTKARKQLVELEKNMSEARISLYLKCGISAEELKRPSTAAINEAQSIYVKAQKGYIRAVLGISDNEAKMNSATGLPQH